MTQDILSLLHQSRDFYKNIKDEIKKTAKSRLKTVDRATLMKDFKKASLEDLFNQKSVCVIVKKSLPSLKRLLRKMGHVFLNKQGQHVFYEKSRIISIIKYINKNPKENSPYEKYQ